MAGPAVYVEIDGAPVEATQADWIQLAPCGCVCGVTIVTGGGRCLLTEDDAMLVFTTTQTRREVERKRADGFSVVLVSHETYKRDWFEKMKEGCKHDPEYGTTPTPNLPGYGWYRMGSSHVCHLVLQPKEKLDFRYWRDVKSACGVKPHRSGSSWRDWEEDVKNWTYECTKCREAARNIAEEKEKKEG